MYYDKRIVVGPSALRHGVSTSDIEHAVRFHVAVLEAEEGNPEHQLRLGFSRDGRLLEVAVLIFDDEREYVIHAMRARSAYRRYLNEQRK